MTRRAAAQKSSSSIAAVSDIRAGVHRELRCDLDMAKKQRTPRVKCRSVTAHSLAQFVDIVHELQEEWSDWEQERTNSSDGGFAHIWFKRSRRQLLATDPKDIQDENQNPRQR